MNTMTEETLDAADQKLEPVVELYRWSTNYDWPTPWALFLDLTGYTLEHFGETLYEPANIQTQLGYVELDYLADALKCYAERPREVEELIEQLERVGD